jgi:hypothetical protein
MLLFARRVEHAHDVTVYCPHHANPRQHRWPVLFATCVSACIAAYHSSMSRSTFGSLMMYWAASRSVTSGFPARQLDRIESR